MKTLSLIFAGLYAIAGTINILYSLAHVTRRTVKKEAQIWAIALLQLITSYLLIHPTI